jgi:hypothetical protein
MEIAEVSSSLEQIALPADQKKAMLQLIDLKINIDMKDVIAELRRIQSTLSNEIKVVYWVIGIAMAIILFVVARK